MSEEENRYCTDPLCLGDCNLPTEKMVNTPAPAQPEASPEPQAREWLIAHEPHQGWDGNEPLAVHPDDAVELLTAYAAAQNAALTQEVERLRQERDEAYQKIENQAKTIKRFRQLITELESQ